MRRVIASEFVSLDGVMEYPRWTFQFSSEDRVEFTFEELSATDALLLGRVTYEGFAAAWPRMTEQTGEYGVMMNGYPKHVVSTSLEQPLEWNNSTLIKDNVTEEVSRLKRQPGKDVLTFGSGDLVNTLMWHELIDEYRLMVFPVVVGSGKPLFREGIETTALKLVETKTFGLGVVLTYRPAETKERGSRNDRHLRHRRHRKHSRPSKDSRGNSDIAVCAPNVTQQCLKAGFHDIQINLASVFLCSGVHLFERTGTDRIEVQGTRGSRPKHDIS